MARYLMPFLGRSNLTTRNDPFLELHREMNRLFDDALRTSWSAPTAALPASPRVDVHETGEGLEVSAELPGVDPKNVELRLDGDVLTLRGEKKQERRDEQAHVMERTYGSFQRTIPLPFSPDPDRVKAEFQDGVLKVTLPRAPTQEKSRRIEIGGGASSSGSSAQIPGAPNGGGQQQPGSGQSASEGQDGSNQGGTDLTGTEAQGMGSAGGVGASPETLPDSGSSNQSSQAQAGSGTRS